MAQNFSDKIAIGVTDEEKRELMRGLGYHGSQLDYFKCDCMESPEPTVIQAPIPTKGVMMSRPGTKSDYPTT